MIHCKKFLVLLAGTLLLLTGCKSFDEYQEDRVAYAVKHFERSQFSNLTASSSATLSTPTSVTITRHTDTTSSSAASATTSSTLTIA